MELMFYDEAARLLGVTVDTLAHAVSRGELTRAGIQGNRRQLIKEQVMLFTGVNPRTGRKKRISYNGLSEQEQSLWHSYANELNTVNSTLTTPNIEQFIEEKIKEEIARQELARIQEEERIEARNAQLRAQQKERLTKDYPFLVRELAEIA